MRVLVVISILVAVLAISQAQRGNNGRGNGNQGNNGNGNQGNGNQGNGNQGNGNGNQGNGNGNQGNGNGNQRNNGNGNQGNGNGNQGNRMDCLGRNRERLRGRFTDSEMDAICDRQFTWMRGGSNRESSRTPEMDNGMRDMKERLNQMLNRKPEEQEGRTGRTGNRPRPRKEYRTLTHAERTRFHNAINALKNFKFGATNIWDFVADYHQPHIVPGAHWGPAFLGWHKQYLLMMEDLLQNIDPSIMMPYWDSTLDSHLGGQASDSIMWSDEFLGTRTGDVISGPFTDWTVPRATEGKFTLWRGNGSIGRMTTDDDFAYITGINNFRNLTWHVDPYYEMVHGMPHLWVGGPMGTITAAAFDPIFYMHHAFIDLMWDIQRDRVFKEIGRGDYGFPGLLDDEAFGVGQVQDPFAEIPLIIDRANESAHYPPKQLYPFPMKNNESLTEKYRTIYYYESRPECSPRRDCKSPYLFCVNGVFKCAPKLRPGADCSNFTTSSDPCYNGRCFNGVCQGTPPHENYFWQFLQYFWSLFRRN